MKAQGAASASLDLGDVLNVIAAQMGQALNVTSAYVVDVSDTVATTVATVTEVSGPSPTP